MTITPTALLSLPIITTGTESGTWGDVVDNGLTSYLDIAIAGGLSVVITTADVTLANTAGTSAATGIISTTAQYAILNISGAKTAARNLNLPISSREYTINNAGTGGFLLTVRGVTPTAGVTLVDGEKAIVAWNGSDYVKIVSSVATALTGVLAVANGGTGTTTPAIVAGTNVTVSGTWPNQTINSSGGGGGGVTTFSAGTTGFTPSTGTAGAVTLAGTLAVANGGTGTTTPAIVAGTNVTVSGTWPNQTINASGSGGSAGLRGQVFTSNLNFTIPTGVTQIKVTLIGGGGGGAVGPSCNGGAGGGGGGAASKWLTGLTPGATIAVVIGAGGAGSGYSVGNGTTGGSTTISSGTQTISTVTATGGTGGLSTGVLGGVGGLGVSGDLNIKGGSGTLWFGGASMLGGMSGQIYQASGTAGSPYGGGGGAGGTFAATGADGVVFFEY